MARSGKESEVWAKVLGSVGDVPAGQRWISIGDRSSDSFDYWNDVTKHGWQCLSRVYINRRTDENGHLLEKARALPAQGQLVVHRRARPGQAACTLHLNLSWSTVKVLPPHNNPKHAKSSPLNASVVRCWDDKHKVEWLLLATWSVNSLEDAVQCVRWYEQHWSIEEFHKCMKTGCGIEKSQLKRAPRSRCVVGLLQHRRCAPAGARANGKNRAGRTGGKLH